jgi:hypothetical protein
MDNIDKLPTMTDEERKEFLEMLVEETESKTPMAVLDGFEDCLLYYTEDEAGNPCAVYCYEDLVESFARKNHTTYTEAVEFVDFNTMRTIPYMTHVGETPTTKPIIIHRINRTFTTLDDSYFAKCYSDDPDPED